MTLKELQEKRGNLAAKLKAHADKQKTWNAEDRQLWDRLNAAYDKVLADIKVEKQIQARLQDLGVSNSQPRYGRDGASLSDGQRNDRSADMVLAMHGWFLAGDGELRNLITDDHREAARRVGVNLSGNTFNLRLANTQELKDLRRRPRNAMSVGDPGSGGATVGSTLMTTLERAMLDFSGVLQVADIMRTTTGEPIEFITVDDTGNSGSLVGESQDAGTGADPTWNRVRLSSYDFTSGMLYVGRSLLRDSIIGFEEYLGQILGERIGRKQNTSFTTSLGGGLNPRGIVTASVLGVTAGSATAIAFDELIDLEHSVDPSRRNMPGVGYMFHDDILKALRKLKDGEGRYLWQAGANTGAPDTLNARPYWINQDMASTLQSGAKSVLFGQLPMFKVRQVGNISIQRLVERRAEFNQDVFIAYASGDSNLLDPGDGPIRHLVH